MYKITIIWFPWRHWNIPEVNLIAFYKTQVVQVVKLFRAPQEYIFLLQRQRRSVRKRYSASIDTIEIALGVVGNLQIRYLAFAKKLPDNFLCVPFTFHNGIPCFTR